MSIRGSKSDVTFLLVLLALSLGFNVYLVNLAFFSAPEATAAAAPPGGPPAPLAEGTSLPPLEVQDLAGQAQSVEYGEPTVLYFFAPDCGWCAKNLANVQSLRAGAGDRYRFVGVSLKEEGLSEYLAANSLDFPIFADPSVASRDAYRLVGVPQTLVVSAEGKVVKNWRGAFSAQLEAEVEQFFGVDLPGLIDDESSEQAARIFGVQEMDRVAERISPRDVDS